MKRLTKEQKAAIKAVTDGADVTGYALARTLREVERDFPALITITKVMGNYPVGYGHQEPYFGAIATAEGLKAAGK